MRLSGRVAVVPVGDLARARAQALVERLGAEGASVVLVTGAHDAEHAGRMASAMEAAGGRPAVFHLEGSEGDLDALVEFLDEMSRPAP